MLATNEQLKRIPIVLRKEIDQWFNTNSKIKS